MSFLLWRALRKKLPTNEKLGNFGVEPVRCFCCYQQGWDEVDHIFIQGHFATYIWKYFSNILGFVMQQSSLNSYVLQWCGKQGKNEAHKIIIQTLPIVICWNLWKNRCSAKYGGKISNISRVKYLIIKDMFQLLRSVFPYIQWPIKRQEVVDMIEQGKHEVRVIPVIWKTPPIARYKLNTDGSALHNPGKIGGGSILRDSNGVIIYAFAIPLGEGTNNQAEVQAAIYGLNWCIQHGYRNIILEVDSELLTRWCLQLFDPPWRICRLVQELKDFANQCDLSQCVNTYQEANGTSSLLSKQSHKQDIIEHYYTFNQLPKATRGSYIL